MKTIKCKCGFDAGKVGYMGVRSGKYRISCENSKCPACVEIAGTKEKCIEAWNEMQSKVT